MRLRPFPQRVLRSPTTTLIAVAKVLLDKLELRRRKVFFREFFLVNLHTHTHTHTRVESANRRSGGNSVTGDWIPPAHEAAAAAALPITVNQSPARNIENRGRANQTKERKIGRDTRNRDSILLLLWQAEKREAIQCSSSKSKQVLSSIRIAFLGPGQSDRRTDGPTFYFDMIAIACRAFVPPISSIHTHIYVCIWTESKLCSQIHFTDKNESDKIKRRLYCCSFERSLIVRSHKHILLQLHFAYNTRRQINNINMFASGYNNTTIYSHAYLHILCVGEIIECESTKSGTCFVASNISKTYYIGLHLYW